MAMPAIVPQCATPTPNLVLRPLADLLKQTHAADPAYGLPFARALDRAVARLESGIHYEPYNSTHYRIQSHSRRWQSHYVTLHQCSCDTTAPWCWHRALLHLLTAAAAIQSLDRCPRPTLASVPVRQSRDLATVVRDADEGW